ncbi:N-acetyltransferase family protein [Clostridium thermobutyricum]
MIIRAYKDEDFKEIEELYMDGRMREVNTCGINNIIDFTKDDIKFKKFNNGRNFVVDVDGEIAGFICLNSPEVSLLYIKRNFTGKGIGKKLLTFGINEIKKTIKDGEKISLDLFSENLLAKRLYESLGFFKTNEFPREVDGKVVQVTHMEIR